jgi:hypothetical protein
MTWRPALRSAAVALVLIGVVAFVGGNFVLVDVRLLGLSFETRLAWAVVVPAALAFGAGVLYQRARSRPAEGPSEEQDPAAG